METMGDRIRARRTALGMTQEQLGRKIGASRELIKDLEGGLVRATTKLSLLSRTLKVNPSWLETGKGRQEPIVDQSTAYLVAESMDDLAQQLLDRGPEEIGRLMQKIVELQSQNK